MKYLLIISSFLVSVTASAAPTHHGIMEAVVSILNANNEADGPFTYKLCLATVDSVDSSEVADTGTLYTVNAYRNIEVDGSLMRTTFSLTIGAYWSFKGLSLVGTEIIKGDIQKFSCPADQVSYEQTIQ